MSPKAFMNYIIKQDLVGHLRVLDNGYNIPWTAYLGVLGMPGGRHVPYR